MPSILSVALVVCGALVFLPALTSALVPTYSATRPDYQRPNGGLPLLDKGTEHITVLRASLQSGTYNHQAQIERFGGAFHSAWKNSPFNEDEDGQRILYSSSADGRAWSPAVDVFPSMPASMFGCDPGGHCWDKIHHEGSPFVTLNGRLYAVSCVRRHGSPGEFFPIPSDSLNTTLLRRVLQPAHLTPGGCRPGDPRTICPAGRPCACPRTSMRWMPPAFGPLWWATPVIPDGYRNVSAAFGIRASSNTALNPEEAADFALFRDPLRAAVYSPDSCRNGHCAEPNEGEQTVYPLNDSSVDVILYRGTGGSLPNGWPGDQGCADPRTCVLLSTSRDSSNPTNRWSPVVPTQIPDLGSNLNAGTFEDGRKFLVWNGVPRPHVNDTAACGSRPTAMRNPLTLAISSDGGADFNRAWALYNSTAQKRFCGSAKPFGPSYPQAREVADEGPALDGLWVIYSINKEDIGVSFVPADTLQGL
eukprot:COSAG02_NODE_1013_length_15207_cov_4.700556_6_plen_475_part_00